MNNSTSDEINNLAQAVFIVLSFCSLLSNIIIYSDKLSENENVKKVTNVYTVFKEYVTNNYNQDEEGNIVITEKPKPQPVIPDSKKLEKDIKELLKKGSNNDDEEIESSKVKKIVKDDDKKNNNLSIHNKKIIDKLDKQDKSEKQKKYKEKDREKEKEKRVI